MNANSNGKAIRKITIPESVYYNLPSGANFSETAQQFTDSLNEMGFDVSVYWIDLKDNCCSIMGDMGFFYLIKNDQIKNTNTVIDQ